MRWLAKQFLQIYHWVLSPLFHLLNGGAPACRFTPTCSHYAEEAIEIHGIAKGAWLAFLRVLRCNPFSAAGYDPVPRAIAKTHRMTRFQKGR